MDAPEATKPFSCTRTGRGGGAVPLPQEKDPGFCSTPDVTARALARVPRAGLSPKCPNASKSLASLNHRSLRCLPTPPAPAHSRVGGTVGHESEDEATCSTDRWGPRGQKF